MEKTNVKKAREFCDEVRKLSKKYNLPFFIVTDGASATGNNGCVAVNNARNNHIKWEQENGFDPYEDWKNKTDYVLNNAIIDNSDIIKTFKLNSILDYANDLSDMEIEDIKKYVEEKITKQINEYKLIKINNKIIGCLFTEKYNDGILLDEIYLIEEVRNKGIGTSIIKDILKEKNIIYLWVYKNNTKALNLYAWLGFIVIEETKTRFFMKLNVAI